MDGLATRFDYDRFCRLIQSYLLFTKTISVLDVCKMSMSQNQIVGLVFVSLGSVSRAFILVYGVSALNSDVAYVSHGLAPCFQRLVRHKEFLKVLEPQ